MKKYDFWNKMSRNDFFTKMRDVGHFNKKQLCITKLINTWGMPIIFLLIYVILMTKKDELRTQISRNAKC